MPIFDVDEIKEIIKAFDGSKATELEVRGMDGERFVLRQTSASPVIVTGEPRPPFPPSNAFSPAEAVAFTPAATIPQAVSGDTAASKEESASDGSPVPSPMVGVFYAASSPDAEPYVKAGSKVHKGDVLCLIEAMKLMNEVTAEKDGEITSVCVENGQIVEYGQTLFMIK